MQLFPRMRPGDGRPAQRLQAAMCFVRFFRDPIACMREAYRVHGSVSAVGDVLPSLRRGRPPRLHVFAFGPRYNEQVLGDPTHFRTTGQTLRGPPGSAQSRIRYGLTRMVGEKHKQQRKLIVPALQRGAVEAYYPEMVELIDEHLRGWKDGESCNLWRRLRGLSLSLASRLLFGLRDPARAARLAHLIEQWGQRNFSPKVWLFPADLPGTAYRKLLRHADVLEQGS